jgi:site-specific recombinase XerD
MWLRIAKEGDLPSDITPHVLRLSFASYFPAQNS